MNDPATTLDRIISRAGELYSLPTVAMEVLQLTNNPQVDTRALKECIENDPALTGKLLRVVNSSLFGLSREVSDLNQALALLGTKPLKLLVLGFSLPEGLFVDLAGDILEDYWRHTLTKAVAARQLSEDHWNTPGDDAFIAGLLQDLGILLLLKELGEPYVSFLRGVSERGRNLTAMELESMGFDHTTLTARMLSQWGLPQALVDSVPWDAAERSGPPSKTALPQILHLAELMAQLLADGRSEMLSEVLEVGAKSPGLSEEQLETLVGNIEEKVAHLADIFSLKLPGDLDYRDVLARAHRQLASVASEAAEELLQAQAGESPSGEDGLLSEIRCLSDALAQVSQGPATPTRAPSPNRPGAAPAADIGTHASPTRTATKPRGATAVDPGLVGQLATAVAASRQSRCSLSLLLVQLVDAENLLVARGPDGFESLRRSLEALCRYVDHPHPICLPHGEAGFALVLVDCDRRQAIEIGNQLVGQAAELSTIGTTSATQRTSVGLGIANVELPPVNFPPDDLLAAADRCLRASLGSGGGVVKSIEIY